ncbi:uncharacterized protein [Arachis hypogaea]|uniref:uncharacterized protein n=1 Tax=Arachis hypogaea TaxID=3818 RepID=UPI003B224A3C
MGIHSHNQSLRQSHHLRPIGLPRMIRAILQRRFREGQSFIPNPDPDKPPTFYVPVDDDDFSDENPGHHCYESEELHSIASDDDTEQTPIFSQSNVNAPVNQVRLEVGMEFETLSHFRKAVRKFNINIGKSIFFSRCDSTRSKAICYDEDCPWQIYCAKRTFPASFQVKTFLNEHTCSRDNHCKSADGKWVIDELEERIRVQPNLTIREADQYFRSEYDVLINERKIYRSMKKAKERIEGSEIAQYARLRDYGNQILKTNPGSIGLIPAVQEIYPNANHRFCAMHIWQNFRKKWSDLQLKMCMWSCAKATTTQDFNAAMEKLKRINVGAWEYLHKISPKQWSRAHFSEYPKLDNYTNNNCEVFNAKVKKMRGKSIITMLEEVRCYVIRIMARNKKALVRYNGRLAPTQQSRLEREKRESNKWRPLPTGDDTGNVYEVHCLPTKVSVDLGKGTCSYRLWQITGLPCRHACAALAYQNRRPEEYAHNWLTMGAYNAAYQTSMRPVPSQEYLEHDVDTLPILPPRYRKPIGRPTLKRDKRNDGPKEKSDPHRTTRRIGTIICIYCLQAGHNKRSCKKRKEAAGEGSSIPQAQTDAEDEDMMAEMYYEETLESAEAEQEATEDGNQTARTNTQQQPHPMPPSSTA